MAKPKKLLVADDSVTIQKVIRLALSNEGYEIQAVSDGNEACQQISLFRPDVVLIDISLPGKSAFEVKEEIARTSDLKHVHFVLMSSAFEKVDTQKIEKAKFEGQLIKPFDPASLRTILSEVLGSDAPTPGPRPSFEPEDLPEDLNEEENPVEVEQPGGYEPPSFLTENAPPSKPFQSQDEEIRQLTDSTMEMSGWGNGDWSIDEKGKRPPLFSDGSPETDSSDDLHQIGEKTLISLQSEEPSFDAPTGLLDTGGSDFNLDQPVGTQGDIQGYDLKTIPLSQNEMEALVNSQLRETLERMARELLPDIAERIIKQEIHRMLSEPPRFERANDSGPS